MYKALQIHNSSCFIWFCRFQFQFSSSVFSCDFIIQELTSQVRAQIPSQKNFRICIFMREACTAWAMNNFLWGERSFWWRFRRRQVEHILWGFWKFRSLVGHHIPVALRIFFRFFMNNGKNAFVPPHFLELIADGHCSYSQPHSTLCKFKSHAVDFSKSTGDV